MKYTIIFMGLFFSLIPFPAEAQDSTGWGLQSCIDYALQHNLSIQQNEKQVDIQENNLIQSKYARLPNLNASGNLNFNVGRSIDPFTNTFENQTIASNSYSLSSGLTVFSGNRLNNTVNFNDAGYQASISGHEVLQNQITLQVVLAYLQIVQAEENLKNAESQLDLSKAQAERAQKLFTAGTLDQGSVYGLQAQASNDQVSKVNAQIQVQLAYNNMLNLLQIPLDTEFRIKQEKVDAIPEMPTEGITDIYERALGILPEIQQSQNQILQAMYNEKIARSAFSPSVSVFGNLSTVYSESARQPNGQYSVATIGYVEGSNELVQTFIPLYQSIPYSGQIQDNFGVTFGASVSVPIFNGMRNSTNLENAKLNSEIAQIQYESIKTNLRSEITNAYTNLLAAKSRYDASINNEKAQKLNYDYAEKRFAAGLINSTELMTAKNLWFQSQNMLLNAKFEYVFRSLLIQYYLGNPLELN